LLPFGHDVLAGSLLVSGISADMTTIVPDLEGTKMFGIRIRNRVSALTASSSRTLLLWLEKLERSNIDFTMQVPFTFVSTNYTTHTSEYMEAKQYYYHQPAYLDS
uniref:Capsid protein n=1 Tax=Haemonchus placei TaxID=6290 RepID=A0A0N4WCE6_HAEPC